MKWLKLFLVILPLACLGAGILAAWILESGALARWEPLGMPPGGALEFVDANSTYVYVRNKTGDIYRCPQCWEEAEPPEKPLIDSTRFCPPGDVRIPSDPGEVKQRLGGLECYADATSYYQYVILSDGSVWAWSLLRGSYGFFLYPLLAITGCFFGVIPIFVFLIYRVAKKKHTHSQTSIPSAN